MLPILKDELEFEYTLNSIDSCAQRIIQFARKTKVWLFEGEMGAGKTTLIKEIGKRLKVEENISSPTFSIVNQYRSTLGETIYHFDFYRIKNEAEAYDIGTEEYLDSGNYCFIEWAEKIPSLLPDEHCTIVIEHIDTQTRKVKVKNN